MRHLLARYVVVTVIKFTLLTCLIILGVDFFIILLGELKDIGTGNYGLLSAFKYALYTLPGNFYSLFPMVALIGNLVGLGVLGSNSELLIMRAAGMSVWQVAQYAIAATIVVLLAMIVIGEGIAPELQALANQDKLIAESGGQTTQTAQGLWFKKQHSFIHVGRVTTDNALHHVTIYQFNKHLALRTIIYAPKATHSTKQYWQLHNAKETVIQSNGTTVKHFDKKPWHVDLSTRLVGKHAQQVSDMSLWRLYNYIQISHKDGLAVVKPQLNLYQRLLKPIATLVMMLLAIPFVFGPLRTVTMGVRILTGCVLGFTFYLLNEFFGPFSLIYQVPPVLGASLPTAVFLILAIVLLSRVR